jgi:hypothetical protein
MTEILPIEIRPIWVKYPKSYINLIDEHKDEFFPWYLLPADKVLFWIEYLNNTYKRNLYPFARKDGTDDFACWQDNTNEEVHIIHTFASSGWEQREIFANFEEWYTWALKGGSPIEPERRKGRTEM